MAQALGHLALLSLPPDPGASLQSPQGVGPQGVATHASQEPEVTNSLSKDNCLLTCEPTEP